MSVLQMSVLDELPEPGLQQRRHWLLRWSRPALGLLLPLGLALGWEISVRAGLFSGRLVPPPSVIYATFVELARTGELQSHALTTLARVAAGFAIGVCVGTVLGAITGYSALVRRIIDPSLQALRAIPSIAWVPAEFMGASEGLGFLLVDGQQLGKPAQIVAAIVAFAVIGKITDWIIVGVSAPFLRWEDRFNAPTGRD